MRRIGFGAVALAAFAISLPVAVAHPTAEAQLAEIQRHLDDVSGNTDLYLQRGEANRRAGRWHEALADAGRALALDPQRDEGVLLRAQIHYDRSAPQQALADVDSYLARHPENTAALQLRARALRDRGYLAESAAAYDVLLSRLGDPRPDHYIERAGAVAAAGHLDAALQGLDEGMARLGQVATLQLAAIDLELRRGDHAAAVARLDRLLVRNPGQAFWMARRAEILEETGQPGAAREGFESALAALPAARPASLRELEGRIRAGLQRVDARGELSSTNGIPEAAR